MASALRQMFSIVRSSVTWVPRGKKLEGRGTGSFTVFIRISMGVWPVNGRRPVRISYSITPSAQMSARRSTSFLPSACSGAM